jgi:hypothetical protein
LLLPPEPAPVVDGANPGDRRPSRLLAQPGGLPAAVLVAGLVAGAVVLGLVALSAGDRSARAAGVARDGKAPARSNALALATIRRASGVARLPMFHQPRTDPDAGRRAALARGLTGYWTFDRAAPTRDGSGNGFDCQLRRLRDSGGSAWSPDRDGGAARFDRSAWLECPQPPLAGDRPLEMTVSIWVNPGDLGDSNKAVLTRAMEGGQGELFFLGFGGDTLVLRSSPWRTKIVWPFPGTEDRWVHLAFSHTADGASHLYVDGVEVGWAHPRVHGHQRVQTPLVVGAGVKADLFRGAAPPQRFAGGVDQLAVYDRVLPPEEIAWLAAGTPAAINP